VRIFLVNSWCLGALVAEVAEIAFCSRLKGLNCNISKMNNRIIKTTFFFIALLLGCMAQAQVRPHHIFDNNMVLQRDKPVKIWGWASPRERVEVNFSGQIKSTNANPDGEWFIHLDPMGANSQPQDMTIAGKESPVVFTNVLVGDVWVLGGQSNMEFDLVRIFHGDAEVISAHYPNIRLMTVPFAANREPAKDFERINEYDSWLNRHDEKGYWFICTPKTAETFSGMGYLFGRRIHMASQIPIGLIDVSVGGTTLEAWLSTERLAGMPENNLLLQQWNKKVADYDPEEDLRNKIINWEKRKPIREAQGLEPLPKPVEPSPSPALDRNFPGSSYNGMVGVIAGLAVKGVVFHHGYNNALGDSRPKLYETNFKALVKDWRTTFNDKDLPFGIAELSAGGEPQTLENYEEKMTDPASYIREGQYNTFKEIPNTGFVSSYDQQVNWYHPQKKAEVSERLARWALSSLYGFDLGWEPLTFTHIERIENKIIITFSKEVKTSDDRPMEGFAVAGSNRLFSPAKAEYVIIENEKGEKIADKSKVQVWSNFVDKPLEVRYAWARNPLGNLINSGVRVIPVPAFRTDSWDYPEAPYLPDEYETHRLKLNEWRKKELERAKQRIKMEAELLLK